MHSPPYHDDGYHHWVIVVGNHISQIILREAQIRLGRSIRAPHIQGHHNSCVPFALGGGVTSPENPPEIVFNSPLMGTSCICSLEVASLWGSSRLVSKYSFKKPSLSNSVNWWPRARHCSILCPRPLWNSHQRSFLNPKFLSAFWGNLNFSATLGIAISSLYDTRNLGRVSSCPLSWVRASCMVHVSSLLSSPLRSHWPSKARKS